MKAFATAVVLLLASAAAWGQAQPARPRITEVDRIVAVVNNEVITKYELQSRVRDSLRELSRRGTPAPAPVELERQVLERMITERVQLQRIGERLVKEISEPYELDSGHRLHIGASVGIALAPEHGSDMSAVMAAADAALYQAKSRGKALCVIAAQRAAIDGQAPAGTRLLH